MLHENHRPAPAIAPQTAWVAIPARGGSKSLPLKNLHPLDGRPLLAHGIAAARAASSVGRVVVTTDHEGIAAAAREFGAEAHMRNPALATDDAPILPVLRELFDAWEGPLPEAVATLYPTSPFIAPETIDACFAALFDDPEADSAQSVTSIPHVFHALSQRTIDDGVCNFIDLEARMAAGRKQDKRTLYTYGNLLATRTRSLLNDPAGNGEDAPLFGKKSILGAMVNRFEALDVDGPEEFRQAEAYLKAGLVPRSAAAL